MQWDQGKGISDNGLRIAKTCKAIHVVALCVRVIEFHSDLLAASIYDFQASLVLYCDIPPLGT
jgi:hypothetical protein